MNISHKKNITKIQLLQGKNKSRQAKTNSFKVVWSRSQTVQAYSWTIAGYDYNNNHSQGSRKT